METSPKFNQVAASESTFKRNRVWSTLAPSCCIPSHPHDLDQLTLICDSVLPQFPGFQLDLRLSWAQEHDHLPPKQSFILVPDRVHYPVCYQSSYCWPSALVPVDESWSKNPSPVSGAKCVPRLPFAFLHIWASLPQVPAAVLRLPTGTSHYFVLDTFLLLLVLGNGDQRLLYPMLDRLHLHVSMWTSTALRDCNSIPEKSHIHIRSLSAFFLLLFVAGHAALWPTEIIFPVFGYLCCVAGESDCHSLHMTQLSYSVYIL